MIRAPAAVADDLAHTDADGAVIVGETPDAIELSSRLLDHGAFVIGFGYPVVPKGTARIRCQISAAHEREHLDRTLDALETIGTDMGII